MIERLKFAEGGEKGEEKAFVSRSSSTFIALAVVIYVFRTVL